MKKQHAIILSILVASSLYASKTKHDLELIRGANLKIDSNDTNKTVAIKVPDGVANDYNLTLPSDAGTANQVLQTDGSGVLSWASAATDTDTQDLSQSGDTVSLVDGGSVDISTTTAVNANTAKVTNATHTGDVTGDTNLTIADDAITTAKIADDAITNAKIADDAVDTAQIKANAITSAKIADGAVISTDILDGTIATVDIADDAVTTAKMQIKDEDTMSSNSATHVATQQSIKAYADTKMSTTLNSTNIFVGNSSNVATGVAMSGDATLSNTGAITVNDKIKGVSIGYTQDPNFTVEPYIVTSHANVPISGQFFHIRTQFYTARTTSANRSQIALPYTAAHGTWSRYYFNSTWSTWERLDNVLDTGAVTTTEILDGTIATVDIADDAVSGAKIAADTIDGTELKDTITLDTTLAITQGNNDVNFDANTLIVDGSANRIGIGTNTPERELHVAGQVRIDKAIEHNQNNMVTYTSVFSKALSNAQTGTMKIKLPNRRASSMLMFTLQGFNYAGDTEGTAWKVEVGGYQFSTGVWVHYYARIYGNAPFTSVQLAEDSTNGYIFLGDDTTVWAHPSVMISDVTAQHNGTSLWGDSTSYDMEVSTGRIDISNIMSPVTSNIANKSVTNMTSIAALGGQDIKITKQNGLCSINEYFILNNGAITGKTDLFTSDIPAEFQPGGQSFFKGAYNDGTLGNNVWTSIDVGIFNNNVVIYEDFDLTSHADSRLSFSYVWDCD